MVVLTCVAVGTVLAAPVALPATGAAAVAGTGVGVVATTAVAAETTAAVAGAAAAGGAAGAVTGAAVGGTAAAAGAGTVVGAAAGAGVTASSAGAAGLTAGIASGPVGWLAVGAIVDSGITWDCWKPILHDESEEKSEGILFKEMVHDPRIKKIEIAKQDEEKLVPKITVMNSWDEEFDIMPVQLPNGDVALHAERINMGE